VPTFFLGAQMFWGNDRLTILKHVLKKRSSR
jgi:2-hydroxychromene-2-carboxylate isomerase